MFFFRCGLAGIHRLKILRKTPATLDGPSVEKFVPNLRCTLNLSKAMALTLCPPSYGKTSRQRFVNQAIMMKK